MLDYIFFDPSLTEKFTEYLTENNIPFDQETDDDFGTVQGNIVSISEEIEESYLEGLQDLYDVLQNEQEEILEATEDGLHTNVAGMEVVLDNGSTCTLKINPEIVSKILTAVTFEELQSFVNDVTKCVQNPDNKPACKKE